MKWERAIFRRVLGQRRLMPREDGIGFADRAMREYLREHPEDAHAAKSYPWDVKRLDRSLEWVAELIPSGKKILELGPYGIASYVLERRYPDNVFVRTATDLRRPLPFDTESFDVVLSMEVIEHVADIEYAYATVLSGVMRCLAEVHRVLKVGGRMFLSTPNACSLLVLNNALRGAPPWQYPFHFREFTLDEIQILVEQAGMHVRECRAEYVWSKPEESQELLEFIRQSGFDTDARGDDIFLVGEKTAVRPVPRGSLALPI